VETLFSDSFSGANGRPIDDQADGLWTGGGKKTVATVQNGQAVIAAGKELDSKATFTSNNGTLTLQATLIRGQVGLIKSQASTEGVTVDYDGNTQVVISSGRLRGHADQTNYTLPQAGLPLAVAISLKEGATRVTIRAGSQTLDTGDMPNTVLHPSDTYSIVLAAPDRKATGIMDDVQLTKGSPATVNTTLFAWDTQGHFFGEYDASGQALQETVYLGDIPVAMLQYTPTGAMQVFYLYTDHLNTPRVMTDTGNKVVWRWDSSDPFGASAPDEDPDGDEKALTFNPRFPGQYFDKETGLYYNYFRDYDPTLGRYVQSDPIGLKGGINIYGYVNGNPASSFDPFGLAIYRGTGPYANDFSDRPPPEGACFVAVRIGYNILTWEPCAPSSPDSRPPGTFIPELFPHPYFPRKSPKPACKMDIPYRDIPPIDWENFYPP
jgi:RHS repeat-associated protein